MVALKTYDFDAADAIDTPLAQAELLADAFASEDPAIVTAALGMIARARGVTSVARDTGLSREAIYKSFRAGGNPTLDTLAKAAKALGLRLALLRTGAG